ncbi:MAG TPA: hypothetical protein VFX52_06990 [Nocardioidaceae bacterium]|nr:hypothetical protein [Nocardioidaceae bacterium]
MTTTGGNGEPGRAPLDRRAYEHLYAHLYGSPQPAPPAPRPVPDHPQAATVLVLGILGAATFGLLAPVAWAMGSRVVREIDVSRGYLGGRGAAQAGRVLGMVSTLLLCASLVFFVLLLTMFGLLSLTV